jgi:NitT/TauT family transport system permease protein
VVAGGDLSLAARSAANHPGAVATEPSVLPMLRRAFSKAWPPLLAAALILGVWELAVWWFQLPNYVLPTPREIVTLAVTQPGDLWPDTLATVTEALGGYVSGSLLGLGLALAFIGMPVVERYTLPLYVTVNSVPMVAYGPLAIIWFGNGPMSKVILILVAVSYTVLINALAGLKSADPALIAMLRTFGASDRTILLKLRVPGALPLIFSGLRVAVVHAMILAVVLEMLGANAGLGWSIYKSTQMMSFVEAWVAVGASVVVSLVIYALVNWAGRRIVWWQ